MVLVAHPFVGATLDLDHCAYFQEVRALPDLEARAASLNETIRLAVRTLGKRLFSIHTHDVRQSDWRDHRCVGSGVIDFAALFTELRTASYSGLFEIELEEPGREAAAARTGEVLTRLCEGAFGQSSGVGVAVGDCLRGH